MFRTFQLLAREYLGEIRVLLGTVGGKNAPVDLPVRYLGYKSPRLGFPPHFVMAEGQHRFPVNREGEQWKWASEPPPGWITGKGIPYNLEEALQARDGRPYGFDETFWMGLKANFMRHATKREHEFPKDFIKQEEVFGAKKALRIIAKREKKKKKRLQMKANRKLRKEQEQKVKDQSEQSLQ